MGKAGRQIGVYIRLHTGRVKALKPKFVSIVGADTCQALRGWGIPFSENEWPYNPHCSLRGGAPLSAEATLELAGRPFPQEEFLIDTVLVYQLEAASFTCKLLWQRRL